MKTGIKRITQVAHCCNVNYSRWRFADKQFSAKAGGHASCYVCKSPLKWKAPVKRSSAPRNIAPAMPSPTQKISKTESDYRAFRDSLNIKVPEPLCMTTPKSIARRLS